MRWRSTIGLALAWMLLLAVAETPHAAGAELTRVTGSEVTGAGVNEVGGLTFQGAALYAGDTYIGTGTLDPDRLVIHALNPATGAVLQTWDLQNTEDPTFGPTGMATRGVLRYTTAFTQTTEGNVASLDGAPVKVLGLQGIEPMIRTKGLAFDGTKLWQAHYSPTQGHLYAIHPDSGDRINDLVVDPYPYGVAWDGKYLWVSHNDVPFAGVSYFAKYDKAGTKLASYALPAAMNGVDLGDLAINGSDLYALRRAGNYIDKLTLPAHPAGPALPSSVVGVRHQVTSTITYAGTTGTDTQLAATAAALPIASSLHYEAQGSVTEVGAMARSYHDGTRIHNSVQALAYGDGNNGLVQGVGGLTSEKTLLIPAGAGLPAGTKVIARGTLTLNGKLQLSRDSGDKPDPTGSSATLTVGIAQQTAGGDVTIFNGQVGLLGQPDDAGGRWFAANFGGSLDVAAFIATALGGIDYGDGLACLELDHVPVSFSVPATIGVPFTVETIFEAQASLSDDMPGIGADSSFGQSSILIDSYTTDFGPGSYADWYAGEGGAGGESIPIPEPAAAGMLLAAGILGALRRRKPNP